MKKRISENKLLLPISILLILGIIIYRVWFSFSAFAFGDWAFAFSETLKDYFLPSAWGIHGGALLWKYPLLFIYGVFGHLGLGFNMVEKFTVFWPIILLAPLSSFLLVKKITNSALGGFIGSLIFAYNSYFLSIDTQGHELLTVAFAFAPFAILAFINLLESKRVYYALFSVLTLFIVAFYDLRSLYVTLGAIVLYALYHQLIVEKNILTSLRRNIRNVFLVFFLFGLVSLYWLLPIISLHSLTTNEFLIRQLFGGQFYSLQSALTLFYPFWTGKEPTWFYVQKIPFSFWLYPILAFAGLMVSKKNKKVAFFGLLALTGVFLTKQEAPPFPQVYLWLYSHVPGFAAFREASKFYFLIAISYAVLIGILAVFIKEHFKNKKLTANIVILCLAILPIINAVPILTGEIKTMFVPKTVPKDFVVLKNFIVNDSQYSRILGINSDQYYNFSTNNHPTLDALYSLRNFWGGDIVSYDFFDLKHTQGEKLVTYFKSDEGKRLIYSSSIGYVVIPIEDKQTNNNVRRDLGKNRSYFEKSLAEISYLRQVNIGLKNILLYKVINPKQHVYLTAKKESLAQDVDFKKIDYAAINPTEFKLKFNNLAEPVYLNFSELYHPDWKIHVGDFRWYEVLFKNEYFLPETIHSQNSVRFNQYLIDPKQICKINTCHANADGSFNFEATLYFRPQSHLYLGLIISAFSLAIIIFSSVYLIKKEK